MISTTSSLAEVRDELLFIVDIVLFGCESFEVYDWLASTLVLALTIAS